jgi:ammonium transporter, Amt family
MMNRTRKLLTAAALTAVCSPLSAQSAEELLQLHQQSIDMIWLIIAAVLVFFMQAGFAMVEIGLTRAKNAGNIIMKNLMDFCAGAVVFWAAGWALMYGSSAGGFAGTTEFFLKGADPVLFRDWMFQVVFAATAATIVSGAMAERTKFSAYLICTVFISGLIYPISGHWIWGGGWLAEMGFYDFAGSAAVHAVGGWAALAGALTLGPRIGKYVRVDGRTTVRAIPGHSLTLASLGVFILWFGWYGFNAGSTLSGTDSAIASIAVTTTLGACMGTLGSMALSWMLFGKPDVSMTLNGTLAGLVGITASAAAVSPLSACVIGLVSGLLAVLSVEFIDKVLTVDDPVGAVSVHGVCGVWGTLAVGLFADTNEISGLFYGGGSSQLKVQFIGAAAVSAWSLGVSLLLFLLVKAAAGLRVTEDEELSGLDISEHGCESYSGFQVFTTM